jgi:energy-coupling factor transporter ATP-binding protein EcfA2
MLERAPVIDIGPDERVLIIGTAGSGKSYLTRRVLVPRYAHRPVVFDPKERWNAKNAKVVHRFTRGLDYQVIRLGDYEEREGPYLWDDQAQSVMRDNGGHTLILDELTTVIVSRMYFPAAIGRAVRTGRDTRRGAFPVWMITQQPTQIPSTAYALANHKFFFMQERERDIQRIANETHPAIASYVRKLRKGDYVYYNREKALLVPVKARIAIPR